jgi:hypothetical protein
MDEITTVQPPAINKPLRFLGIVSQHFAVVSTFAVIVGIFCSTVFLYGYIRVFDWHLIWIIEYGDVLKFGLVAVAFISGFFYWIQGVADDVLNIMTKDSDKDHTFKKALGAIFFCSFAFHITSDETSANPYWALHIYTHLSIIMVGFVTFRAVAISKRYYEYNLRAVLNDVSFFVAAILIFGSTLGYYVRDIGGIRQAVTFKDGKTLDAGIVMITSHHFVLYANGQAITVPSGDVTKIVSIRDVPP